jgi:hypothetical protein
MTKQQTIELLEKQMPGFYSAQQVVDLIKGISDESSSSSLSAEKLEELVEAINSKIKCGLERSDADELVDFDSAEYSVDGHYIQFDSIDVDIKVDFEDEIRDVLTEFFKPEEEEEDAAGFTFPEFKEN